jgi:hypothetical protein
VPWFPPSALLVFDMLNQALRLRFVVSTCQTHPIAMS